LLALYSVTQSAPPGPAAIPVGLLLAVDNVVSVKLPAVVNRPTLLAPNHVNQGMDARSRCRGVCLDFDMPQVELTPQSE
jgi:hypothetical protein